MAGVKSFQEFVSEVKRNVKEVDPATVKGKLDKWLVKEEGLKQHVAHALIGKYVFLHYLRDRDILSARKLEGWKVERVDKKAGVVVQTFLRRVSDDGKTMTVTHKTKGAKSTAKKEMMTTKNVPIPNTNSTR